MEDKVNMDSFGHVFLLTESSDAGVIRELLPRTRSLFNDPLFCRTVDGIQDQLLYSSGELLVRNFNSGSRKDLVGESHHWLASVPNLHFLRTIRAGNPKPDVQEVQQTTIL